MNERVCKFGPERSLLGIASDPDADRIDQALPTVILLNAGLLHHVGQNRLNVTLARYLAELGYPTLRFDFSGLGDSMVRTDSAAVRERNVSEIQDAMNYLQETRDVAKFVIIGLCTGADNAHRAAVADNRIVGVVMLDGYSYLTSRYIVQRFRSKLLSPTRWKNFVISLLVRRLRVNGESAQVAAEAMPLFWELPKKSDVVRELLGLADRRVQQLQIFSGSNIAYNYAGQYVDSLRKVNFGDLLRVLYVEKADHTYSMLEDRSYLVSEIGSWLDLGFRRSIDSTESAHLLGTNPQVSGILSQPKKSASPVRETGVVILSSGLLHRVGPFRLHVGLARSLSLAGYSVLRLDQTGRGDSSRSTGMSLAETIQKELDTASVFFKKTLGIDRLVLVGLCSGADDALELASENENIAGLILFDGYAKTTILYFAHYYLRRILDLGRVGRAIARGLSNLGRQGSSGHSSDDDDGGQLVEIRNFPEAQEAANAIDNLMDRGGSMLSVFTGDVEGYYCYEGQLQDCLGGKQYGQAFKEVYFRNAKHTYPVHDHRKSLVRLVTEWSTKHIA